MTAFYRFALVAILMLGTILVQPRMKALVLPQYRLHLMSSLLTGTVIEPQQFWQIREFASLGQFQKGSGTWPNNSITQQILPTDTLPVDQIITYDSNQIESLDAALSPEASQRLLARLGINNLSINTTTTMKRGQDTWLVGLFDAQQARKANGFFFEDNALTEQAWLDISRLKGM